MKVLHLAAGNRWTGAAAPAFAETEALREAGVDAHYAYVGGYKLQQKIGHHDFAHPIIAKAQNPFSFARTVESIARLIDHHRFEIVHAHLTYDHWLAHVACRGTRAAVVRTFHARRVLRGDPLTVYGDGQQTRSFCYVEDTVDGLVRMMESDIDGPVNIGNPEERTVLELAEIVLRLTGSRSRIVRRPLPADDPQRRKPDISLARTELGWQPRVALEDGLARTTHYFRELLQIGTRTTVDLAVSNVS
jgi:hypothetical protein